MAKPPPGIRHIQLTFVSASIENMGTTARSCEITRRWTPSSMTKVTIQFTPLTLRKSRNESVHGGTTWVNLLGRGSKPCSGHFLGGEESRRSVWLSAWNTLRLHQR